jgi:hypothetical protein
MNTHLSPFDPAHKTLKMPIAIPSEPETKAAALSPNTQTTTTSPMCRYGSSAMIASRYTACEKGTKAAASAPTIYAPRAPMTNGFISWKWSSFSKAGTKPSIAAAAAPFKTASGLAASNRPDNTESIPALISLSNADIWAGVLPANFFRIHSSSFFIFFFSFLSFRGS